jgi:hypothetical protein
MAMSQRHVLAALVVERTIDASHSPGASQLEQLEASTDHARPARRHVTPASGSSSVRHRRSRRPAR